MMRDNFTGKPVTMARLRKSIYPSPIWQAELSNGETLRLSFNCPGNTSRAEMIARARFQAADFIRWYGSNPGHGLDWQNKPYPRDIRIETLYMRDRRGETLVIAGSDLDPWQDYSAVSLKNPAKVTVKHLKTVLADVLKIMEGTVDTTTAKATLEQAKQLLEPV